MKISWVLSEYTWIDHKIDINALKDIGSFWGSWKTWRNCSTDNVVCNDLGHARNLISRKFNEACNFYIPERFYIDLERPDNVKLFGGQFNFELDCPDDVISMQLASTQSDIVLLYGFDWSPAPKKQDRLDEHRAQNYRTAIKHAIEDMPSVQWVLIDHAETLMPEIKNLENLTVDTLSNVLSMLGS